MTILKINRKANADRKGPRNPIATFAVAGSNSASTNLCVKFEAECNVSGMPFLGYAATKSNGDKLMLGEAASLQQHKVLHATSDSSLECVLGNLCLSCHNV